MSKKLYHRRVSALVIREKLADNFCGVRVEEFAVQSDALVILLSRETVTRHNSAAVSRFLTIELDTTAESVVPTPNRTVRESGTGTSTF
jgi:hypothetical protein